MITQATGLGIGVGRVSKLLRGVGVIAMLDGGLDTMRCVESVCEVPADGGLLQVLVSGMVVGVFIDHCCVVN